MCTVTLYHNQQEFYLTMTRDELLERHEAAPYVGEKYCYPVDAQAKGTWFGVSRQGVGIALLNNYLAESHSECRSRGEIILAALQQGNGERIRHWLEQDFQPNHYNPFHLLVVDPISVVVYHWDRDTLIRVPQLDSSNPRTISNPWTMLTSSSGDSLSIIQQRQKNFQRWSRQADQFRSGQEALHSFHLQAGAPPSPSGVLMQRPDRHSKSICQLSWKDEHLHWRYFNQQALVDTQKGAPLIASAELQFPKP